VVFVYKVAIIEKLDNTIEKVFRYNLIPILLIFFTGLFLRLHFAAFDLPSRSRDAFVFLTNALSMQDSLQNIQMNYFLWPGILAIIFTPFHFEDYEGYFTVLESFSILLSASSAFVVYLIAKEVMSKKIALIAMVFFAVEPNIVEYSIFGTTESLFILFGLITFYFTIQKNDKLFLLAFIFAGLSFDARPNGVILLLIPFIALFFRKYSRKQILKFSAIGITLILITILPLILDTQRTVSNLNLLSEQEEIHPSVYHGAVNVGDPYLNSALTILLHLFRISVPYLGIFAFFGFIVSIAKINWRIGLAIITVLLSLIIAIPQYTYSVEIKNLYFIIPFFALFSGIGIDYIINEKKFKNILLISLILGLSLTSFYFLQERQPDPDYLLEKERIGKYITNNLEGTVTGANWNFIFHNINKSAGNLIFDKETEIKLITPSFIIESEYELIKYLIENEINYLVISDEPDKRFLIFSEMYFNETDYEYLSKIFDSDNHDYEKYRVKIFVVDQTKLKQ